jgi:hypothetical protein
MINEMIDPNSNLPDGEEDIENQNHRPRNNQKRAEYLSQLSEVRNNPMKPLMSSEWHRDVAYRYTD